MKIKQWLSYVANIFFVSVLGQQQSQATRRRLKTVCFAALAVLLSACALDATGGERDSSSRPIAEGKLIAHFIDADQGDATLLQGPDFTILIDTGRHDRNDVIEYLKSQEISHLDLVIGTHPHSDHIGQLDQVLRQFSVSEVWMSGDAHTSRTFERTIDAILSSEANYHEPRAGEKFTIGSAVLEVIHPERITGDLNNGSISTRISFGDVVFLFTGDTEKEGEEEILKRGHQVQANIFHVGHHGSSTSNTKPFLKAINPDVAIYSAGNDNDYGHPHREVIQLMEELNIPLYGTDELGTILVETDGKSFQIKTAAVSSARSSVPCVDINTATKEQLQQIAHIGPDFADQIIALRPFSSIDELTKVNGIGQGRLRDIKEQGLACVRR